METAHVTLSKKEKSPTVRWESAERQIRVDPSRKFGRQSGQVGQESFGSQNWVRIFFDGR
jgi:hypothetical protein